LSVSTWKREGPRSLLPKPLRVPQVFVEKGLSLRPSLSAQARKEGREYAETRKSSPAGKSSPQASAFGLNLKAGLTPPPTPVTLTSQAACSDGLLSSYDLTVVPQVPWASPLSMVPCWGSYDHLCNCPSPCSSGSLALLCPLRDRVRFGNKSREKMAGSLRFPGAT